MVATGDAVEVSTEAMFALATAFSEALRPDRAAEALAVEIDHALPGGVAGALLLSTAASGSAGRDAGALLRDRWADGHLAGTAFEGLLAHGRVHRDRPAMLAIAWGPAEQAPIPFLLESDVFAGLGDDRLEEAAHLLEESRGDADFGPDDLVLLFPDSIAGHALESGLAWLGPRLGNPAFLGAAASGGAHAGALAWADESQAVGGTVGLIVPGGAGPARARLGAAGATRFASPWLEIGDCRSRWVDELDGEPALDWVRRQLGLADGDPVERHLDRLMVRLRTAPEPSDAAAASPDEDDRDYAEHYVVGLDDRRGSISIPGAFGRGEQLAFALPDPAHARSALRQAVDGLADSPLLLQFACRARDASLHGDADLEGALVQHAAGSRAVVGTVAPFQIGPDARGVSRQLVHTTVLAALGSS